jgi:hypothetical protein
MSHRTPIKHVSNAKGGVSVGRDDKYKEGAGSTLHLLHSAADTSRIEHRVVQLLLFLNKENSLK